ncbi:hypothetical protein [Candidatus Thiosymbion oneisti]|uniref:hypothetical protein n=1 Tax=Candidatus Thiosymbion oneisti TaxID=589554 RepID=UPI000B7E3D88|nr:hypothetical protein [Candidatus Thiosymbion oneisti]
MNSGINRKRDWFRGALYSVHRVTWCTVALRRTRVVPLFVAFALTACAGDGFRTAVGNFATTTEAATAQQVALQQKQFERRANDIADELANKRVELVLSVGCAPAIEDTNVNLCFVERRDREPLVTPFNAVHITNLRKALGTYASNLALLAAGAAESDAAFRKQVDSFAASLGGLSGALKSAIGTAVLEEDDYTVAAKILAELGSLYFEYQRINTLRKIIIETDPVVQKAAVYLAQTDVILMDADNFAPLEDIYAAEAKVKQLTSSPNATTAAIRKAQTDLIAKTEAYRMGFRDPAKHKSAFTKLAKAHAELAKAAKSRSSSEDLEAAVERIVAAAESIRAAVKERSSEDDSA